MNIVTSIIILLGYTIALCIKGGGVPSSLSASVFDLPKSKRWIWTVMLYAVCFCVLVPFGSGGVSFLDKVSENSQFLVFIAIAALAFVGAAPLVADKTDLAYKVHCVAAVVCAVCSQLVLTFNQPWLLFCWFPFVVAFVYMWAAHFAWRTKTFWAEMVCFGSTFIFCLI
jgi:cation transport ATPase